VSSDTDHRTMVIASSLSKMVEGARVLDGGMHRSKKDALTCNDKRLCT
jgi:hypothetical protein